MSTSENRRWAVIGPLSVALWVVGIILINRNGPRRPLHGQPDPRLVQIATRTRSSSALALRPRLPRLRDLRLRPPRRGWPRLPDRRASCPGSPSPGPRWPASPGSSRRPSTSPAGSTRTTSTPRPPRPSITLWTSSSSERSSRRSCRSPRWRSSRGAPASCRAGGPRSPPRRDRARRRADRLARPDLRRAALDARHEPLRAARFSRADADGGCRRLRREWAGGALGVGAPPSNPSKSHAPPKGRGRGPSALATERIVGSLATRSRLRAGTLPTAARQESYATRLAARGASSCAGR